MLDYRTGIGYDSHRLKDGIPLQIGGIRIPHPRGLAGHSDGDVLLHAVVDALLGGIAKGDIGSFFPDKDPKWKGADSKVFVKHAYRLVRKENFFVHFVDCIVVAEEPKLAPYYAAIRDNLAALLQTPPARISVKAKTAEGMGSMGKGNAMAAFAAITLANKKADPRRGRPRRGQD